MLPTSLLIRTVVARNGNNFCIFPQLHRLIIIFYQYFYIKKKLHNHRNHNPHLLSTPNLIPIFCIFLIICFKAGVLSRAAYHNGVPHTPTTMNHLPVPEGDWQEAYNKKQSRYNAQLLGSALFFFGIVAYVNSIFPI